MSKATHTHLAESGRILYVRVTPKASRNAIEETGDVIKVYVTAVAEDGKANAAATKILAKALGIAKSRLVLEKGQTSRNKVFRVD